MVQQPVVMAPGPEPIVETYYLAPIFTGIIVMNPPEKKPPKPKHPPAPAASVMPPQPAEPDTPRVPRPNSEDELIPRSSDNTRRTR